MAATQSALHVRGLGKKTMAAVMDRAKRLGLTPDRYIKRLVKEDLAVSERAKTMTFDEILGPGQAVDERELDALVEKIRTRHYQRRTRKG